MDKAHASVFKVFMQLLDDGILTDGKGNVVDFKNTIIIMSSNLGAEHLTSRMTGENTKEVERDLLMKKVGESQTVLVASSFAQSIMIVTYTHPCRSRNASSLN